MSDDYNEPASMLEDAFQWCHETLKRGASGHENPEERSTVRSMPIVLHIPKAEPPHGTALLEATASAVAELCLDSRVAPGGPWHHRYEQWMDARMRKISRRARGGQWAAVQQLSGITSEIDGAQARAFVPSPVDDVHPHIARLQIGGTDLPAGSPGIPDVARPILWLSPQLEMSIGKIAAQVGHGVMLAMGAMTTPELKSFRQDNYRIAVRTPSQPDWSILMRKVSDGCAGMTAVVDAGFTEIAPGSLTVISELPR